MTFRKRIYMSYSVDYYALSRPNESVYDYAYVCRRRLLY